MASLSDFLKDNKEKFLADVNKDGAKEWTIVMGNEAGDLDSCASAIAFSYLTSYKPCIGLIQTPRPDLRLRPENLEAFGFAHIDEGDLLTITDIPIPPAQLKSAYALVDHNSLLPIWNRPDGGVKVVAVLDHHADEGKHLDASPRRVQVPLGSCTSLVADTFKERFTIEPEPPKDLATLLLTGIYIDTNGLKADDKAESMDYSSASFLEAFAGHDSTTGLLGSDPTAYRKKTAKELRHTKENVSKLSTRDLLRRDYKQYEFLTSDGVSLSVGLSSVPLGIKDWVERDAKHKAQPEYRKALELWAAEERLDVIGVLTSYKNDKDHKKRDILMLVGGASGSAESSEENVDKLFSALTKTLEGRSDLKLDENDLKKDLKPLRDGKEDDGEATKGKIILWKQGNTDANRKVIAPAFETAIKGLSGVTSTVSSSANVQR